MIDELYLEDYSDVINEYTKISNCLVEEEQDYYSYLEDNYERRYY